MTAPSAPLTSAPEPPPGSERRTPGDQEPRWDTGRVRRVPLTRCEAAEAVEEAIASTGEQRVGVELEWPVSAEGDPCRRPEPEELARVVGTALPHGGRVTLEPGGQIELSTAPAPTAGEALRWTAAETAVVDAQVRALGFRLRECSIDTVRQPHRVLQAPRYAAMERFFTVASGEVGRWMMCNTAGLQVNISHGPGAPEQRWRSAARLGPVLVAAFANSPGHDRSGRRWESLRQGVWWSLDPVRTRALDPEPDLARAWLDYALAADVMLLRDPDTGDACPLDPGLTFARWCREGIEVDGRRRYPEPDDLRYHLTTLFPPIRPRGWLELRMLDALPAPWHEVATLVIAAALCTDAGEELAAALPDTGSLWCSAARSALAEPVLADAARRLFEVTMPLLGQVGADATQCAHVERYFDQFVARGLSPAQLTRSDPADSPRPSAELCPPLD